MKRTKLGLQLEAGLKELVAYEKGNKKLRATTVEIAKPARRWGKNQIIRLRKGRFGVSQPVFASYLSVSAATVRAWEQGQKSPSGAARRLLEVADIEPAVFARFSKERPGAGRANRI